MSKIDDFLKAKSQNNENASTSVKIMIRSFVFALVALSLLGSLHPQVRGFLQSQNTSSYRKVLSSVNGVFYNDRLKIVKIKNNEGLFLEIYKYAANNLQPLIKTIKLPDTRDGYIMFQQQATNLALEDIDGDQQPEIIAPSYDKNLAARLNVYKFDSKNNNFNLLIDDPKDNEDITY